MNVLIPLIISFYALLKLLEAYERSLSIAYWIFLPIISLGYLVFSILVFYLFNL